MPKANKSIHPSFELTRGEIQKASKTLENQIFSEPSKDVYISLIEQIEKAQNEGDRISADYERLLSRWSEIPTIHNRKEHGNTHYDYAVHLASLRMYYHFLSEQTTSLTEKEHFLTIALEKSELSLKEMNKALLFYTNPSDIQVTQGYIGDYTFCHDTIRSELQELNGSNIPAKNSNPQGKECSTLMKKRKMSVEIPRENTVDDTTPYTPTLDNFISMFRGPDKKKSDSSTSSTTSADSDSSSINVDYGNLSLEALFALSLFNGKNYTNALPGVTTPFSVLKKRSRTPNNTEESSASTSSTPTLEGCRAGV